MLRRIWLVAALVAFPAGLAQGADARPDVDSVLDAFVAAAEKSPAAEAKKKVAAKLVAELRKTPEDKVVAITEALRVLYPEYKDALAALGDDNVGAAIVGLSKLRQSTDPFLAADSSYYLARAYLLDEHFEDALPLLADLQSKWADKTASGGEVLFLQGVAEVAMLKHKEAELLEV